MGRASLNVRGVGKIESNKGRAMRASLLWSMFQTEVACSTGHASGPAEVAQILHTPPPVTVSTQSLCYPAAYAAFQRHGQENFPHSPGFWHCAHKHDSQDKRQAKRFCKPFMKHNEVFMEHIILKGKIAESPWCTLRRDEKLQLLLSSWRTFHSSATHFLPMRK